MRLYPTSHSPVSSQIVGASSRQTRHSHRGSAGLRTRFARSRSYAGKFGHDSLTRPGSAREAVTPVSSRQHSHECAVEATVPEAVLWSRDCGSRTPRTGADQTWIVCTSARAHHTCGENDC